MPVCTSEGVRHAHRGELAPQGMPPRTAVQRLGCSSLSFSGRQATDVAPPPHRNRQTWKAALKSRQWL
eukprot:960022-Heterocapsa_arctica.AAC.1